MQKLDIFNHIFPKPYYDLMMKVAPSHQDMGKRARGVPMLFDLDERFRVMDPVRGLPADPLAGVASDRSARRTRNRYPARQGGE